MTTKQRHDDPTIDAFLKDGNYPTIEDWMKDSDFRYSASSGEWYSIDDAGPDASPWDPDDAIAIAIEACGFEA